MELTTNDSHHAKPTPRALGIGIALTIVILGAVVAMLYVKLQHTQGHVPASILQQAHFPIYVPRRLPGNFTTHPDSFAIQEEGVFTFKATDSTDATLAFTEQKRVKGFDFAGFYDQQMMDASTVSNTPYPTVWGKTLDKKSQVVSIVTDDTWILVTTTSPLNIEDMRTIAATMQAQ